MSSETSLLREYVKILLGEADPRGKKLVVFDFDDTLVRTGSRVRVRTATGQSFDLSPGEYASYDAAPDDEFDFSDFERLIDPQEITWTGKILRAVLRRGGEVVILTARNTSAPVEKFLKDAGISGVQVVAVGTSDPSAKAEYVERRIRGGINSVEFFDDSHRNVRAVENLSVIYPDVRIVVRHVVHRSDG